MTTSKMKSANNKQKIYFFDFDDTLVNNHEVDFRSFEKVIKTRNLPKISREELLRLRMKGLIAEDIFKHIFSKPVCKLVNERKKVLTQERIWDYLKINPGVMKTLKILKQRGNLVFIITKKSRDLVIKLISNLKLDKYIDEVYCTKNKDVFVKDIIKRYPDCEITFISDSEEDLLQIRGLDIITYCFYNKYKNKSKMAKLAKVITSMDEML